MVGSSTIICHCFRRMVIQRKLGKYLWFALINRYFYSLIYVGTPPQRQTVILDTGSSILAFPCDSWFLLCLLIVSCTTCGTHQNHPFAPSLSKTIRISLVRIGMLSFILLCAMQRDDLSWEMFNLQKWVLSLYSGTTYSIVFISHSPIWKEVT